MRYYIQINNPDGEILLGERYTRGRIQRYIKTPIDQDLPSDDDDSDSD